MTTTNNTNQVSTLIITVGTRQMALQRRYYSFLFDGVKIPTTSTIIKNLMMQTLKEIGTPPNFNNLLMRSLYQWGLQYLEDAS
jgi:hypothetical protein